LAGAPNCRSVLDKGTSVSEPREAEHFERRLSLSPLVADGSSHWFHETPLATTPDAPG
jgi:hypothetical protein